MNHLLYYKIVNIIYSYNIYIKSILLILNKRRDYIMMIISYNPKECEIFITFTTYILFFLSIHITQQTSVYIMFFKYFIQKSIIF